MATLTSALVVYTPPPATPSCYPTTAWDLSEILDLDPHGYDFTCVGFAHTQGRRCRNPIARANRDAAVSLLAEGSKTLHLERKNIKNLLAEVASRVLCRRWHQNQTADMASLWLSKVTAVLERAPADDVWLAAEAYDARVAAEAHDVRVAAEAYAARVTAEANAARIAAEAYAARIAAEAYATRLAAEAYVARVMAEADIARVAAEAYATRITAEADAARAAAEEERRMDQRDDLEDTHEDNHEEVPEGENEEVTEVGLEVPAENSEEPLEEAPTDDHENDAEADSEDQNRNQNNRGNAPEDDDQAGSPPLVAVVEENDPSVSHDTENQTESDPESAVQSLTIKTEECEHSAVRKPIKDEVCYICYEDFLDEDTTSDAEEKEQLMWCKAQCGINFHKECIEGWFLVLRRRELPQPGNCPNCRARWRK